jgi:hypothetical protein
MNAHAMLRSLDGSCRTNELARGRLRFAFYGRVSTEDYPDPVSSRLRQRDQVGALVAGHGRIVAEFFDVGQSQVLPGRADRRQPLCSAIPSAAKP